MSAGRGVGQKQDDRKKTRWGREGVTKVRGESGTGERGRERREGGGGGEERVVRGRGGGGRGRQCFMLFRRERRGQIDPLDLFCQLRGMDRNCYHL